MLQKCPTQCCENALKRCKNALNMLQKFRNFTMHILLNIIIIIIKIYIWDPLITKWFFSLQLKNKNENAKI